jgi:hypothetical protein
MKHRVLLLSLVLCGHIRKISPASVIQKHAPEPEQTSVDTDYRHQAPNVDLPLPTASVRYLQAVAEEMPPSRLAPPMPAPATTAAPSEEPTMLFFPNPSPGRLPGFGPDPCPPSSTCLPDYNLMYRALGMSCTNDCVPDARVGRKKAAGWKCGRCP